MKEIPLLLKDYENLKEHNLQIYRFNIKKKSIFKKIRCNK